MNKEIKNSFTIEDGVLKKYEGTDIRVSIPYWVKEIADGAFAGNSTVIFVRMSSGVKTIGSHAFENCQYLKEVLLSDSVEEIGEYAFANCRRLENILMPSNLKTIEKGLFANCYKINKVVLPSSIKSIGDEAFKLCSSLQKIIIPDGTEEIGINSFYGCSELIEINLPNSLKKIGIDSNGNTPFNGSNNVVLNVNNGSYSLNFAKANKLIYKCDGILVNPLDDDNIKTQFRFDWLNSIKSDKASKIINTEILKALNDKKLDREIEELKEDLSKEKAAKKLAEEDTRREADLRIQSEKKIQQMEEKYNDAILILDKKKIYEEKISDLNNRIKDANDTIDDLKNKLKVAEENADRNASSLDWAFKALKREAEERSCLEKTLKDAREQAKKDIEAKYESKINNLKESADEYKHRALEAEKELGDAKNKAKTTFVENEWVKAELNREVEARINAEKALEEARDQINKGLLNLDFYKAALNSKGKELEDTKNALTIERKKTSSVESKLQEETKEKEKANRALQEANEEKTKLTMLLEQEKENIAQTETVLKETLQCDSLDSEDAKPIVDYRMDIARKFLASHEVGIEILNLTTRTKNTLLVNGYRYLHQLIDLDEEDYSKARDVGVKSTDEACLKKRILREVVLYNIDRGYITEDNYEIVPVNEIIAPLVKPIYIESSREEFINNENETDNKEAEDNTSDGKGLKNYLLEELPLSVRAQNALKRAHIYNLNQLRELPLAELYKIRNLGATSIAEIQQLLHDFGVNYEEDESPQQGTPYLDLIKEYYKYHDKPISDLGLSVRSYNALSHYNINSISELIKIDESELFGINNIGRKSIDEIVDKKSELIQLIVDRINSGELNEENINFISKDDVLKLLKENICGTVSGSLSYAEIEDIFIDSVSNDDLNKYLEEYVDSGEIVKHSDDTYSLIVPSFEDVVKIYLEDKERDILIKRLNGATLEETSEGYGVTRERIRQLQTKALKHAKTALAMNYDMRRFAEDEYKYLFTHYNLDKPVWLDYLSVPEKTFNYLLLMYNRGDGTLEEAIEDEKIPVKQRKILQRFNDRNYIVIENSRIRKTRPDIEDYIIRKYCTEETSIEDFLGMYEDFINSYNLQDDEKLLTKNDQRHSRENRLTLSRTVLYSPGKVFRYYDIDSRDYSDLLDTLNLSSYKDTELSTNKWITDYPQLMRQYDIRNSHELHNLLKKLLGDESDTGIRFSRNPMVYFGKADREKEVTDLLFEIAPVSKDDFVSAISDQYGVDPSTAIANWITYVEQYKVDENYFVDFEEMPSEQLKTLDSLLTEELYFVDDIKRIFRRNYPDSDDSLISSFNLSRLGFKNYSNYVVRNKTGATYFKEILTKTDIVNYKPYNEKYGSITLFSSVLSELKDDYTIIEFEPFQLIQMSKLEASGITKQMLHDFCDEVYSFVGDDYFSIKSIRQQGFESELDSLGFDDWFYASLLREDERFSYQRIGGTVVFRKGEESINQIRFYSFLVNISGGIDIDELVKLVDDRYGIITDRLKIMLLLKETDIYYDKIMEKLYPSYDVYFEEI